MEILRTPDERFEGLAGYPFKPHYVEVDGLRMHYLDEGRGEPVLMLHGEPTWSYLYRKMTPVLAAAGLRAVAPDLIGFGRSDKPADPGAYTYKRHLDWLHQFLDAVGLEAITLVGQDWGSLTGLRLVVEDSGRFARVVMANGFLPTGDVRPNDDWFRFRDTTQRVEVFDIPRFVQAGCVRDLEPEVRNGYDAPFPEERFKVAARKFPLLVPTSPEDPETAANRAAWEVLSKWTKPFLTVFGAQDKIFKGLDTFFHHTVPGCGGQPHTILEGAGHFIQEDKGEDLARIIAEFVAATPG